MAMNPVGISRIEKQPKKQIETSYKLVSGNKHEKKQQMTPLSIVVVGYPSSSSSLYIWNQRSIVVYLIY